MNTFDDLLKNREKISKAVQDATEGEIIDFDFMIDHLTMGGRSTDYFSFWISRIIFKKYSIHGSLGIYIL